jgi:NADPH:quinone reductase-like Zn-dependent oxidoreductase
LPARMRAIRQETFGGPEVLRLVEVERPEPMPTEVLVRVHAAGVNPVDWWTRSGKGMLRDLPMTVGWDVSGVVEEVSRGVTRFAPGDEVFGMPWFPRQAGAYADYLTAPSRQLARKPARASHLEAGGLPLAGLTAWQILVDTARVEPGQRVLVTAAGGGVGHLAVQIAKARGAHVITTASRGKHDFVRGLGADEVLDSALPGEELERAVTDVDVALDLVGGEASVRWLEALRPGGLLVPITGGGPSIAAEAAARGRRATSLLVEPDARGLEALAALVDAGQLRVEIDTVLPLEEAAKAHEISQAGHARGKIVLEVVPGQ